jgi:hypothetical protein
VTTRRATPAAAAPAVADWRSDDLDVVTHRAAAEQ